MTTELIVKFPALFAEDHWYRELPSGALLNQGKRQTTFSITDTVASDRCDCSEDDLTAKEILEEWASDAEYYVFMIQEEEHFWTDNKSSFLKSAKRTAEIANALLEKHWPKGETK